MRFNKIPKQGMNNSLPGYRVVQQSESHRYQGCHIIYNLEPSFPGDKCESMKPGTSNLTFPESRQRPCLRDNSGLARGWQRVELAFIVFSADLLVINGSRIITLWSNDLACVKMLRVTSVCFLQVYSGVGMGASLVTWTPARAVRKTVSLKMDIW